jgi:hypothetical protein
LEGVIKSTGVTVNCSLGIIAYSVVPDPQTSDFVAEVKGHLTGTGEGMKFLRALEAVLDFDVFLSMLLVNQMLSEISTYADSVSGSGVQRKRCFDLLKSV